MHPIYSLNDLESRTNPELVALCADLNVLLSDPEFTCSSSAPVSQNWV